MAEVITTPGVCEVCGESCPHWRYTCGRPRCQECWLEVQLGRGLELGEELRRLEQAAAEWSE
jgi:hypothetical protein